MIAKALQSLRPGATWIIRGEETLENLEWTDSAQSRPTDEEILAEAEKLRNEWAASQYQRDRARAYPKVQDQLDMLYWDKINGTDTWLDSITAIKEQIPKN
jgi:hypothetical protein